MALSQDQIADLVIATLSAYKYSLDSAWELRGGLKTAGLCTPKVVLQKDAEAVVKALKAVGYDRGKLTAIIAPRLQSLMAAIDAGHLHSLVDDIAANDEDAFRARLEKVKGAGPMCSRIAWILMAKESAQ